MTSIRSGTLTPLEHEILTALQKGRGRAGDVAKRAHLDIRVTWQAMQRLYDKGLIEKDEFDVYNITEKGTAKLKELERDKLARVNLGLVRLSRRAEDFSEEDIDELFKFAEKVGEGSGEDQNPAASSRT